MTTRVQSISHYACPDYMDFPTFLDRVQDHGFTGFAATARTFENRTPTTLKAEADRRGLAVTSVNSAGYFLNDDKAAYEDQAKRNALLLERSAAIEAHALNVLVGGPGQGTLPLEAARARAVEELGRFHERARALGVFLIVEPVHPAAIGLKGCLNTLRQVREVVAPLSHARINLDFFHSWWDPDLWTTLRDPKAPLGLLQICDVELPEDGLFARRVPLEAGLVDTRALIRTGAETFPDAPIELELFPAQLTHTCYDFDDVLKTTRRLLDSVLG